MPRKRVDRTRTDEDRIEHIAEANGTHVVDLHVDVHPWLGGTVTSTVRVQQLTDDLAPADALEHGTIRRSEEGRAEEDEGDPDDVGEK